MAEFVVKLMFEWGGGCVWCADESTSEKFGVGPIEDRLLLSTTIRARLIELSCWHDGALNQAYPPDPSPWTAEERKRFETAVAVFLNDLRTELGPSFEVVYVPL